MSKRSVTATRVAFGDVVQLAKQRSADPEADGFERVVGLEHLEPGDLRVRRWGDVADGTTFTNVFHPGQVLFGKPIVLSPDNHDDQDGEYVSVPMRAACA